MILLYANSIQKYNTMSAVAEANTANIKNSLYDI